MAAKAAKPTTTLQDDGSLGGHIYFHLGDDSGFRAEREGTSERA
jgi:hypothetical protein